MVIVSVSDGQCLRRDFLWFFLNFVYLIGRPDFVRQSDTRQFLFLAHQVNQKRISSPIALTSHFFSRTVELFF